MKKYLTLLLARSANAPSKKLVDTIDIKYLIQYDEPNPS